MGSRHLCSMLPRPAPFPRPSTIQCLFLPPPPRIAPSTRRTFRTSSSIYSAQPQLKVEEPLEPPPTNEETSAAIDALLGDYVKRSPRAITSSDELQAAHARSTFGLQFSQPNMRNGIRPNRLNLDDLDMPEEPEPVQVIAIPEDEIKYPRLNPAYGRTVILNPVQGRDIVRGINMLGSLVARNKVRSDLMKQRFHERPGVKRKRLHSERWRARFKIGFDGVCQRVAELTRKGW